MQPIHIAREQQSKWRRINAKVDKIQNDNIDVLQNIQAVLDSIQRVNLNSENYEQLKLEYSKLEEEEKLE
jgi:DNA repair ATPase RecN